MMSVQRNQKFKPGLISKILISIFIGVLCGLYMPEAFNRLLVTLSDLFAKYIGFIIPLMILAFVTSGIADLPAGAGKLLAVTVGLAYCSTLVAGSSAYAVAVKLFPSFISAADSAKIAAAADKSLAPYIKIVLPAVFDTISALVLAFVLGLCLSATNAKERNSAIYRGMKEFTDFIIIVLKNTIIPLLPLYVCGVFTDLARSGQVFAILSVLWKVFAVVIMLHLCCIALEFAIAGVFCGKSPLMLLMKQIPGYATALGTQSSAATIPVNLSCAESMGISAEIRNFTVPLCATVHMCGSMITITCCAVAVLLMNSLTVSFGIIFPFMCTLAVAMVAAPGAPGGAIMTALPFLPMIGIAPTLQALMISLYIAQDSFGTACNVSCDNALGLVVDKISGHSRQ